MTSRVTRRPPQSWAVCAGAARSAGERSGSNKKVYIYINLISQFMSFKAIQWLGTRVGYDEESSEEVEETRTSTTMTSTTTMTRIDPLSSIKSQRKQILDLVDQMHDWMSKATTTTTLSTERAKTASTAIKSTKAFVPEGKVSSNTRSQEDKPMDKLASSIFDVLPARAGKHP